MEILSHADADVFERARLSRDERFDGRFFVGVKTTGIYCRPICPANLPNRENVRFFTTAAAAVEAGYRPCLRCRPECAPGTPAWAGTSTTVQRGLRLIAHGALDRDSLEGLAGRLGVTGRHLRRLFSKHVGASPQAVAHTQRLHFAKRLIDETTLPMKDVSLAAGFGSVRRFNDAIQKTYSRSPRDLRRGSEAADRHRPLCLKLPYRRPYDWDGLLAFFAARAVPGLERIVDARYQRCVRTGGRIGVIDVRDAGGALSLTTHGVATESLFGVVQKVRSLFDVDAPIDEISHVLGRDRLMRSWLARYPGVRVPGAWDGWELAVRAILGQQVSVRAATALAGRLVETYGEIPAAEAATTWRIFPSPERLARARLERIGISRSRARSIRELARAVLKRDVRFDATQRIEEFRAGLTAVHGIGAWTAEYVAMRALKDPDAFPATDLGLLRAFDRVAGRRLRTAELEARAANWRPWRAYAARLAWSADNEGGG